MTTRVPAVFVGHGAPLLALDPAKGAPFRQLGADLGALRAILVVSAHWEKAPVTLGATTTRPLIYDFYGFPKALYEVKYPAPGAPEVARRLKSLLGAAAREDPERGLDHGAWTPLVHMAPQADVPVLQVSLPSSLDAQGVFDLGKKLAPLRDEGILLLGSGNVTHNLRAVGPEGAPPERWAVEFDQWTHEALAKRDFDTLLAYRERAPALRTNHPTLEHWLPIYLAAGASAGRTEAVSFPVEGFELQNLSRRAVRFG